MPFGCEVQVRTWPVLGRPQQFAGVTTATGRPISIPRELQRTATTGATALASLLLAVHRLSSADVPVAARLGSRCPRTGPVAAGGLGREPAQARRHRSPDGCRPRRARADR